MKHAFHIYALLLNNDFPMGKEDFMWRLFTERRIKTWSHYMPNHLTTAYRNLGHSQGECPVAEALDSRYVSLPIHPRLTAEAIEYQLRSIEDLAA